MTARLLEIAEDTLVFLATLVGVLLVLHLVDRIAFGLAINGGA